MSILIIDVHYKPGFGLLNHVKLYLFKLYIDNLNQTQFQMNSNSPLCLPFLVHKCRANKKRKSILTLLARAEENKSSHKKRRDNKKQLLTAGNRERNEAPHLHLCLWRVRCCGLALPNRALAFKVQLNWTFCFVVTAN